MDPALKKVAAKRDLSSGPLLGNLIRLSVPLAAGVFFAALYNLVDAFWLGRWSKEALAAPGVTMPFMFVVISFAMGFGNAGTALVAQYTGARRHREADHVAGQVLLSNVFVVMALSLPLSAFARPVLLLFRTPHEMLPQAVTYMRIIMIGLPVMAFFMAYGAILRALGDTISVLVIGALSNALNMVLDPLLIFGWGRFPAMGVGGAALASVTSQALSAAACYVLLRRHRAGLYVEPLDFVPDGEVLGKMFRVGLPAALGNSSNSLGFTVFQGMVNSLGVVVIGAFTIGFRLTRFFQIPMQALSMAAAPIVGQALGAGKPELARRVIKVSVLTVAIGMLLPVASLMWQGQFVASLFIKDRAIIAETGRFFLIVPASSYLFGMIMVLMAAFYGSGHTMPAMFLSFLRWLLRIPVAYALGFLLGWGSRGVYMGMVAGNVISAVVALILFFETDWQKAIISEKPRPQFEEPVEEPAPLAETEAAAGPPSE